MQDRLPGELRLLGITDIDGANNVLTRLITKHNETFAVLPAEQESACVEPAERVDVDFLFAHREMRKTDCGGSISYKGQTYATSSPAKASMARSDVEVREDSLRKNMGCLQGPAYRTEGGGAYHSEQYDKRIQGRASESLQTCPGPPLEALFQEKRSLCPCAE